MKSASGGETVKPGEVEPGGAARDASAPGAGSAGGARPGRGGSKPLMRHPFRWRNLRPRTFVPIAAGFAVLAAAEPSAASIAAGLPLILLGVALRVWGTGYLLKTDELVVVGPYAHLRHPLYAGTLLAGSGAAFFAGFHVAVFALPAFLLFFFAYYFPYKERVESKRLEKVYGRRYREYHAAVRPLLPSLRPWQPPPHWREDGPPRGGPPRWSFERFRENDELGPLVVSLLVIAVLLLDFAAG